MQTVKVKRGRPGTGLGLFAEKDFKKGEFIAEYTGVRIATPIADTLKTKYLFEINEKWTVDGSSRSNLARYINHSCFPNSESDVRAGKILISALRPIMHGEEITMDYGDDYVDEFIKPFGCKCGACDGKKVPQKKEKALASVA
jgi:SET domain-containing protein